jgi:predicted secreted hydrolase
MWDFFGYQVASGKTLSLYRAKKHKNSTIKQDKETSFNIELKMKEKNVRVNNSKHMFIM